MTIFDEFISDERMTEMLKRVQHDDKTDYAKVS